MNKDFSKIFPALKTKIKGKKLIYLDNACTAVKNEPSAAAQKKRLLEFGYCAGARSFNEASLYAQEKFANDRTKIAQSLKAKPSEVVFVSGTTEAANILASSFPFEKGDEIFISALEHNSVYLPFWRTALQKGLKLKIIPIKNYKADFSFFASKITEKTKLLCLTMASNITGGIEDFQKFSSFAKERKVKVFLDAAQYVFSHGLDFSGLQADFAAFSGHKISAPFGIGVFLIREKNFDFLKSSKLGGGTVKKIEKIGNAYRPIILENNSSFEAGIQNYSGAAALAETLKILEKEDWTNIRSKTASLSSFAKSRISSVKGVKILGEGLEEGSLLSFVFENKKISPADFQLYASNSNKYSFAFRTGKMCADLACLNLGIESAVRISFGFYNEEKEIELFAQTLEKFIKTL
ncbi:MAG: aminotransferase class V-fold PLP-dependent enzyme [Elusimicrobiota bacterium]